MKVPNLPPDLKFRMLTPTDEEVEFSFQAKKQALGPHIIHQWGWDEKFQREVHDQRLREKPFCQIELNERPIGTLSLQLRPEFVRFGEFYLIDSFRGLGIGSKILAHCLELADDEDLPVRLEYLLWNPVGSLYRRYGFVEVGRTSTHFLMERPLTCFARHI
ncbi:GNAT family N-acetyltransferase [Agrobacterium rhizogenes]|uniref:GNAT family N-acetyltransferase n=2 Tax=Rhizobium rhizogenes TaxID=359 RepID=UPI00115D3450|nr:GNAT family N-acetyltransferase [Rhizobium rhizogenes]NTG25072.1 GNAT family N-acetyltransferase [Rhizobium rhizogenes]NTG29927.1 GNAT family N-acetyltransferase [Rhizobium rhizogenes]NTH42775.1 GNAT family N-acetyltransferase [Rhizobium rhizogenes]NTH55392.1 GNAT family N-acetyltransferase [Rhizobium rhizogenes]NTH74974.1 GNAT family N-acetyltransferase [Rhizobium rhizogenes]